MRKLFCLIAYNEKTLAFNSSLRFTEDNFFVVVETNKIYRFAYFILWNAELNFKIFRKKDEEAFEGDNVNNTANEDAEINWTLKIFSARTSKCIFNIQKIYKSFKF